MTITTHGVAQAPSSSPVDGDHFREAAGHFASGVAIITTNNGGQIYGTTVSAVTSLSMEPPMMLVCLNRSSVTHDAILGGGRFGISILSDDQADLVRRFAGKGVDKFSGVDIDYLEGIPMLTGAIASMVCDTETTATGGTHTVFLGKVSAVKTQAGDPLAYFRGGFGSFQPNFS